MTEEAGVEDLLEHAESLLGSLDNDQGDVLNKAIDRLLSALPLCTTNNHQLSICLQRLCFAYRRKFRESLVTDDIDMAVTFGIEARDNTPKSSTEYVGILNTLAMSLTDRWRQDGDIADLDSAIECAREAADLSPPRSYQRLVNHHGLVTRISLRFKTTGTLQVPSDLGRTTCAILSNGGPGHDVLLQAATDLAQDARAKFESSRTDEDLDLAFDLIQPVVQELEKDSDQRSTILEYVSNLWFVKYQRNSGDVGLSRSLDYSREAFIASDASDTGRSARLLNYFKRLAILVTSMDDLDEIDQLIQRDKVLLQEDCPMNQDYVNALATSGTLFAHRYRLSSSLNDLAFLINHAKNFGKLLQELRKAGATEQQIDLATLQALMNIVIYCMNDSDLALPKQVARSLHSLFAEASQSINYIEALAKLAKHVSVPFLIYASKVTPSGSSDAETQPQLHVEETRISEQPSSSKLRSGIAARSALSDAESRTVPTAGRRQSKRNLAIDRHSGALFWDFSRRLLGEDEDFPEGLSPDQFRERYDKLERESRAEAEARGERPDPNLCRICRFTKVIEDDHLSSKPHVGRYIFGNRDELSCRQHCSVCKLVMRLITSGPEMKLHPQLASVERDVQGVQLLAQVTSSGESVMAVQIALRIAGTIRLLTEQNYMTALRQSHEISSTAWELCQKLGPDSHLSQLDQKINPESIRTLLDQCQHNHGEICNGSGNSNDQRLTDRLLFIDVQEERIVNLPYGERYVALSYVWGRGVITPVTLLSNLSARRTAGSLSTAQLPNLPRTIRDAFVFVRNLGERFLWIDALCIVQDDANSKHDAIARMDEVYGGAYATIVAAHGADANAGLPGVQKSTRDPQLITTIQSSKKGQSLSLVSTPPTLGFMLSMSTWDSRGWTFQERLLSKRCIYFTRDFVYFHCPCVQLCCEAEILDSLPQKKEFVKKTETRTIGLSENPLHKLANWKDGGAILLAGATEQFRSLLFGTYRQLIEMYSSRDLSVDGDAINAVSGIFAVMQKQYQQHFPYGLPSAIIDIALLWLPAAPLQRRPSFDVRGRHSFPTWCWAGWKGSVQYRFVKNTRDIALPESLIDHFEVFLGDNKIMTLTRSPSGLFDSGSDSSGRMAENRSNENSNPGPDSSACTQVSGPEPGTLRFHAEMVDAAKFKLDIAHREDLASSSHDHALGSQSVAPLLDRHDRRCGVLFLPDHGAVQPITRGALDFVTVSRYRSIEELPVLSTVEGVLDWAMDSTAFPDPSKPTTTTGVEAHILVALLIENHGGTTATRVTVAAIHSQAWSDAGPQRRQVDLL